jgi:hypothetical protein
MKSSRTRIAPDESSLCQFPFADGRTCRMLRYPAHPTLCIFHAHQEQRLITHVQQLQDLKAISAELASLSGGFQTVSDIHHVIGKLFKLIAANRIPRREAQTLAYLAQLLLHSQHSVRGELIDAQDFHQWRALLRQVYPDGHGTRREEAARQARKESAENQDAACNVSQRTSCAGTPNPPPKALRE